MCEMVDSSQQKVLLSVVSRGVCVCEMLGFSQEKVLLSFVSRGVCMKWWVSLEKRFY